MGAMAFAFHFMVLPAMAVGEWQHFDRHPVS
jgi:hypothetical protein